MIDLVAYRDAKAINGLRLDTLRNEEAIKAGAPEGGKITRCRLPKIQSAIASARIPGPESFSQRVSSFIFPLVQSYPVATITTLCETPLDLPRFNDALNPKSKTSYRYNKDYRYVYAPHNQPQSAYLGNSLVKVDIKSGTSVVFGPAEHVNFSEPVFVARPGSDAEDDGVLVSVMCDCLERKSYLMVIDARSMAEVARVAIPQIVPAGFHGTFVSPAT
jgi:hypothetical protein